MSFPELKPAMLCMPAAESAFRAQVPIGLAQLGHDICKGPPVALLNTEGSKSTVPLVGYRFLRLGGVRWQLRSK